MENSLKIIIHIKDVSKPIVFTTKETKEIILNKFLSMKSDDLEQICLDNGDLFVCRKCDIRAITITTEKQNQND